MKLMIMAIKRKLWKYFTSEESQRHQFRRLTWNTLVRSHRYPPPSFRFGVDRQGGNRMIISVASLLEIRFPCQIVLRIDLPGPMGIFFTYRALYTSTYPELNTRGSCLCGNSQCLLYDLRLTLIRDVAYSHSTFNAKHEWFSSTSYMY